MKIFTFSISLFISCLVYHDIQVTFFKIYKEDHQVVVEVIIEKEEIIKELGVTEKDLASIRVQSYLNENFSLIINGNKSACVFENMSVQAKHINIRSIIPPIKEKIKSLEIQNTCLLSIEDHSNIIEIRLNNQERDFLMNHDRTTIEVSF